MTVNKQRSNIVRFRQTSVKKTTASFKCGNDVLNIVEHYMTLELLLTKHLDYHKMAQIVAKSASRALGMVIAKFKTLGGMPCHMFTKLNDSLVWCTISYGAAV